VFRAQGSGDGVMLHDRASAAVTGTDVAAFVSDVAVAVRRSAVLGEVSYRDVAYAVDQLLGRDMLEAGHVKAYVAGAVVGHSNDGSLREFGERALADRRGLNLVGIPPANVSWWAPWARLVKWSAVDSALIVRDRDLPVWR